ncbi:MAG TPA: hypothetical protein VFZ78_05640, partial [Flavisolibacter sp.]
RKKQQPAIYLGANVPLQDTLFLVQRKSPEFIYMHITSITRQKAFVKYLTGLREKAGASRLLLSGASIRLISNDMAENTTVFPALQEVMSFIDGL